MSRLNYRHLYYFWCVAVVGKLTQVASELHISQSALSTQIKQFEQYLGQELFLRQNRKLTLSDEGKRILRFAEDIFTIGADLEAFIEHGLPTETERLSIGVLNNLSSNFVEDFVSPMLHMDNVNFSLENRGLENLLKGLANHDFDLVLTNCTIASFGDRHLWQTQLVAQQPVAVVGPTGKQPKSAFPEGYEQARWVLPGPQTEIRSAFEAWCAMNQYAPNIKSEANDMAMLRLLCRDSGTVSVLPPVAVKEEIAQGILEVYELIPGVHENFYAIANNKKYHSELITRLLKNSVFTHT